VTNHDADIYVVALGPILSWFTSSF